ncbi:4-vinyl reductase [Candidatus Bathyarchaeota archaeon]|nr:4-vinyl reductase [Candidatus Bathyarchaeota archaeon]
MSSRVKTRPRRGSPLVMREVTVDAKKGTLNAYGERFIFIPVKLIHSIEDRLTKSFGPVTATSFEYEIGREGGAQYIRIAENAGLSIRTHAGIQEVASILGTASGWGRLEVVGFDIGKKLARIRWTNGVSVRNRKGRNPVCHFGRGILTGALSEVLGVKCESIEVSCQGKGDSYCEAVIAEPKEINRLAESLP